MAINPLILGGLISGGSSILGSLIGGGKSSGTVDTTPKAGEWDPDSKKIWDEAMAQIFGESGSSLKDSLGQDDRYQRAGYEDFLTKSAGTTQSYVDQLADAARFYRAGYEDFLTKSAGTTQGYVDQLADAARFYLSKPVSGSIGGQGMSFIPRRSMESYDAARDYAEDIKAPQDIYNAQVHDYVQDFTPNKAKMKYLSAILPLARELQAQRWGQQSTSEYQPSALTQLSTAAQATAPWIMEYYKQKKNPTYNYGPGTGLAE